MSYKIKLTDENMQTYKGFQWALGKEETTSGVGALCGPGWLHCYDDLILGLMFNPIHAVLKNPRAFKAWVKGKGKHDLGRKSGYKSMTLVEELPVPKIPIVSRVAFGILCSLRVYRSPKFIVWANTWLSGEDRSEESAAKAARVISVERAAESAAWATMRAVSGESAAWAAERSATASTEMEESAASVAWAAEGAASEVAGKIDLVSLAHQAMKIK